MRTSARVLVIDRDYDELASAQVAYDRGDPDDPTYAVFSPRALDHLVRELHEGVRTAEPVDVTAR